MSLPYVYFRYSIESHRPSETSTHAGSHDSYDRMLSSHSSDGKCVGGEEWSFIDEEIEPLCDDPFNSLSHLSLHNTTEHTLRTSSQGVWGLFVPRNHDRILTATSISPNDISRQRGSHYTTQQDHNYWPRDYATFAQSGLLRPFACASVECFHILPPLACTWQVSPHIHRLIGFA